MANTINDLYLKYVNRVGRSLENDRYFQYLFEMIQAGEHTIQQHNRLMHKVVDERWIGIVEESLDAINNIIDKPRRFIATNEQLVPVALAKKISAESVRHLSRNTQFIASNENGDVMPSKILNVSTEESYDLYENRFIYHLIQRLVTFIDKRTDIIFWSTGDEKRNRLCMESTVEDGYEEINYKIEMVIKNRQSFAENDADNIPVFMRIDRVRRLTMSLRDSAFCSIMAGCAKVRSPIQRTNLMMKDPDYRTCYKLWQFLENYDEIGYTIEEIDTALEFDEEYLIQLYTNLITNYTVFKSLLEADERDIFNTENKKHKTIKPKFIKKIQEEIVEDYDIPDVEIRKVLIEEVTQAQLDAEAKVEELTKQYQELEEVQQSLEDQIQTLYHQINAAMDQAQEADRRAWDEQKAKEEAQAKITELEENILAVNAENVQNKELVGELTVKLEALEEVKAQIAEQLSQSRMQCENLLQQKQMLEEENRRTVAEHAQAESLWQQAKAEAEAKLQQTRAEAEEALRQSREEAEAKLQQTRAEAEAKLQQTRAEAEEALRQSREEAEEALQQTRAEAEEALQQSREEAEEALQQTRAEAEEALRQTRAEAEEALRQSREEAEATLQQTRESYDRQVAELEDMIAGLRAQLQQTEEDARLAVEEEHRYREAAESKALAEQQARAKAEEKAEGNRISKLLGTVIRDRRLSENRLREQIMQELEAQKQAELTENRENEEIE